jgi:asparagine N-glycosylation enzyme membrane subunit Stt3
VALLLHALDARRRRRGRLATALLAGLCLACYLLTWSGGALFVAILAVWAIAEVALRLSRQADHADLLETCAPTFGVAALLIAPWARVAPAFTYQLVALCGGLFALLILHGLARVRRSASRGRVVLVAALAVGGVAAIALSLVVARSEATDLVAQLLRFSPFRSVALAGEAQPLMLSDDASPFSS